MRLDQLEASHEILERLTDAKLNTNDIAIRIGSRLREIAIKDNTYDALLELADKSKNHGETYDGIKRRLIKVYKEEEKKK